LSRQRRRSEGAKQKDQRNSEQTLNHDSLFSKLEIEDAGAWRCGKTQRGAVVLIVGSYVFQGEDVPVTQVILKCRRIATPL
jgi:hypothetical protein